MIDGMDAKGQNTDGDDAALIEMIGRNGEAWLARMLVSALEVRADASLTDAEYNVVRGLAKAAADVAADVEHLDHEDFETASEAAFQARCPCPGCGCLPGDGRTPGCTADIGCGRTS